MKSFLTVLILLSSSVVFAARFPTLDEFNEMDSLMASDSSLVTMIKDIKSGKINPIVEFTRDNDGGNPHIISKAGRSSFASSLIGYRFDARKPIGNEQENLLLLDTIIKAGVDLNILQTDNGDFKERTLMDVAANFCAPSVVDLLIKNGANPSLEDFYWVDAFRQWFYAEIGSQFDKNCFEVADKLSDKATYLSMYSAVKLFFPQTDKENGGMGSFTVGGLLTNELSQKMKYSLENNLGIKLSTLPSGDEPSKEWGKEMFSTISVATGQDYQNRGMNWWNKQNENQKAWACYFSSFDEALTSFHNNGLTDEFLMTRSIGGTYTMRVMSEFMVKTFAPYCNSLK